jgi:hypothetical protein
MSKPDDVPEWAWDLAIAIETGYEGSEDGRRPKFIARALIAAERRGIERAAEECDRFAKTGQRLWAEDETDRAELHLAQAYGAQSCAAAIRQIGASE